MSYWTDVREERIICVTPGYRLVALNAKTGMRIAGFGEDGIVDMKKLAVDGNHQPIGLMNSEIGLHFVERVFEEKLALQPAAVESAIKDRCLRQ